jgi:hypothetical protein
MANGTNFRLRWHCCSIRSCAAARNPYQICCTAGEDLPPAAGVSSLTKTQTGAVPADRMWELPRIKLMFVVPLGTSLSHSAADGSDRSMKYASSGQCPVRHRAGAGIPDDWPTTLYQAGSRPWTYKCSNLPRLRRLRYCHALRSCCIFHR